MPKITHFTSLLRDFDAALNQFKAIDLGMSDEERYPSCGIGCYDPKKKTYPSIYLTGPKDDFMDLPDSGEAVIKYQVTRRSTEETDGKKRHSLTIEVRSIDPKASMKAAEKKKAEGRAVPIKMEMGEGSKFQVPSFTFNRPRDGDGQFVANVTGGADPVTMRQAYGPDPKKSKLLAPGAAAAALGTAGLLGTKAGRVMAVTGAKRAARVVRSTVTGIDRAFPGKTSQGQARTPKRGRAEYPVMGRKVVRDPGFGETLLRQRMRGD